LKLEEAEQLTSRKKRLIF